MSKPEIHDCQFRSNWAGRWTTRDGRPVVVATSEGGVWFGAPLGYQPNLQCTSCGHDELDHEVEDDNSYCVGGAITCGCHKYVREDIRLRWDNYGDSLEGDRGLDLMKRFLEGKSYR